MPREKPKTRADHEHERRVIDGAYALVQGALGNSADLNSDEGYVEWQKPEIQAAAMEAARAFLAKINPST